MLESTDKTNEKITDKTTDKMADKTNEENTAVTEPGTGNRLVRLLTSEGMRYLFIGGCTTLVNLVVYTILCKVVHLNVNISNIISVAVSILFAYVTGRCICTI